MGMYTELIFGARLDKNTPKEVIDTLNYLSGNLENKPEKFQWKKSKNPLIGGSNSFGVNEAITKFWYDDLIGFWVLSSRTSIKNYDNEIETFLEWIKPYIDSGSGNREFYAIVIYEDADEPTIYYLYDD